jgi:hypothetical protein
VPADTHPIKNSSPIGFSNMDSLVAFENKHYNVLFNQDHEPLLRGKSDEFCKRCCSKIKDLNRFDRFYAKLYPQFTIGYFNDHIKPTASAEDKPIANVVSQKTLIEYDSKYENYDFVYMYKLFSLKSKFYLNNYTNYILF